MGLEHIPIVGAASGLGPTGQAEAVLREIATLLERLLAEGEGGSIDLRGLPLSPADRDWLRDRLGTGEVSIHLEAGGASRITETGLAGVWWVEHRNEDDALTGEFIEVAVVPSLLPAHPEDIEAGLRGLKSRLDF